MESVWTRHWLPGSDSLDLELQGCSWVVMALSLDGSNHLGVDFTHAMLLLTGYTWAGPVNKSGKQKAVPRKRLFKEIPNGPPSAGSSWDLDVKGARRRSAFIDLLSSLCFASVASDMAWTGSRTLLRCTLALLLLHCQDVPWAGARSLQYVFTSQKFLSRQWSCEIQGYLDKIPFLHYSSSDDKASPLGHLGMRISATETWKKQIETLKDAQNLFYLKQLDNQQTYDTVTEPSTLQVTLHCQMKSHGDAHYSWVFDFNGQMLYFAPDDRKWTEDHPGSSWMKEWKDDSDMSEFLYKTALGDCKSWLEEFLVYSEETSKSTAPPATTSDMSQSKSAAIMLNTSLLWTILTCLVLLVM